MMRFLRRTRATSGVNPLLISPMTNLLPSIANRERTPTS